MNPPHERLDAHFTLIQTVISRQAGNSFVVKGWALTAALALYGFAIENESDGLAWLGVCAAVVMWILDSYFLRQERLFRCLYVSAIAEDGSVPLYSLNTQPFRSNPTTRLLNCAISSTLLLFYGAITTVGIVLGAALSHG